jgi:tetratricopeptide (TPR) repeat protein
MVAKYYPHYPDLPRYRTVLSDAYLNKAMALGKEQKYAEAILEMQKGLEVDPDNAEIWYNIGGAYYTVKDYQKALEAWEKTLQLKPDHQLARNGYTILKNMLSSPKPLKKQIVP